MSLRTIVKAERSREEALECDGYCEGRESLVAQMILGDYLIMGGLHNLQFQTCVRAVGR